MSVDAVTGTRTSTWRVPLIAGLASRLLVWIVGIAAYVAVGATGGSLQQHADPAGVTTGLGSLGNALAAPAYRWDSVYYTEIAAHGYDRLKVAAFFPLYPWLMGAVDVVVGSPAVAGVIVSLAAFLVALVLLQRLAIVELGSVAAGERTVWLLALFPTALFFSAVYTEALFLLLTVGAFLCARRDRWLLAGLLGGAAALTRNVGLILLVPLALLYLYGPRGDRPPDRPAAGRCSPRYRLRPDLAFLLLIPLGTLAVMALTWRELGDPFVTWTAQTEFFRRGFAGPYAGVPLGAIEAVQRVGDGLTGAGSLATAGQKVALLVVAVGALAAGVAMLRDLPVAYGAYVLASLLPALSTPASVGPLNSSPRFVAVAFPIFVWLGRKLDDRRRFLAVCALFALGLAYSTAKFATWHFVS